MSLTQEQQQHLDIIQKANQANKLKWVDTGMGPVAALSKIEIIIRKPPQSEQLRVTLKLRNLGQVISQISLMPGEPYYSEIAEIYIQSKARIESRKNQQSQEAIDELRRLGEGL